MEEVEQIASRIVIMDKGKDIVSGTTEQLKEMISTSEKIVVSFLEIEDKVVEQIRQAVALNRPIDGSEFEVNYIEQRDQEANPVLVIFYSLIAMVSAYGLFIGIETVSIIQANLSNVGIRLNVTPLKKQNFLIAGTIVAFTLNVISNGILLLFIKYILKIELFTNFSYSFILIIFGNLFGVALGVFIGAFSKKDAGTKTAIGIATTLFLSFLSGLMGPFMKSIVDEKAPIIGRINPFSIITNNLYRINLLGSTETLVEGIVVIGIFIVVLLLGSYYFLRGKTYDSL